MLICLLIRVPVLVADRCVRLDRSSHFQVRSLPDSRSLVHENEHVIVLKRLHREVELLDVVARHCHISVVLISGNVHRWRRNDLCTDTPAILSVLKELQTECVSADFLSNATLNSDVEGAELAASFAPVTIVLAVLVGFLVAPFLVQVYRCGVAIAVAVVPCIVAVGVA